MIKIRKFLVVFVGAIFCIFCAGVVVAALYSCGVFFCDINVWVKVSDCETDIYLLTNEQEDRQCYFDENTVCYYYRAPDIYYEALEKAHEGCFESFEISDEYAVGIIKLSDWHTNYLKQHLVDQLLYLDADTGYAEVIYECFGYNLILFTYDDIVVIYNGEANSIQYISLTDDAVLHEDFINLDRTWSEYVFRVHSLKGEIEVWRDRMFLKDETFTVPIWKNNKVD